MRTAVQAAWVLIAFAMFVLALIGLRDLGASAQTVGWAFVGVFVLAWVTYRSR